MKIAYSRSDKTSLKKWYRRICKSMYEMKVECLDVQEHTGELDKLFTAMSFSNIGHSASTSGKAEKHPDPILGDDIYMM